MAKQAAGLLLHRFRSGTLEVLLVHPGGPFWARKDDGAWTLPKGELAAGEEPIDAARREFEEETGATVPGPFASLGTVRLAGGKIVHGFAAAGDLDAAAIVSNTFEIEWPPRSGHRARFPEVDRAGWFALDVAEKKIHSAQLPFLTRLAAARAETA